MFQNALTREGDNHDGAHNAMQGCHMIIMPNWKNIRQEKKCFDK